MKTYIALLRGINVGGNKKVPMAELRELLEDIGLHKVSTYIQSGNVVFNSNDTNIATLEKAIQEAIYNHFGFDVYILIKTREDLQTTFNNSPFDDLKKRKSYFIILNEIPKKESLEDLLSVDYPGEEFTVISDCIYLFVEAGYGRAKCTTNFFERKLKVNATARNYNTMKKLLDMSH